MRCQVESVLVGEVEFLWGVTPRWTMVFFGGAGRTASIGALDEKSQTVGAGGLGFWYCLARKLGLQAGVDIAPGGRGHLHLPDDGQRLELLYSALGELFQPIPALKQHDH